MSTDLNSEAERERNKQILVELKPGIIIGKDDFMSDIDLLPLATVEDVMKLELSEIAWEKERRGQTLYYNYTGGSTSASKCVCISHEMACYEVQKGYPSICTIPSDGRVLQHTSCYWGASCLGQLSYWLAFQCTLVVVEDGQKDVGALKNILNKFGVTVIGVVPSVLDALTPQDCRTVATIFTWGEALATSTVETWTRDNSAKIYDLLISTEYWLSLYREPPAQSFKVLPDVIVSIRSDQKVVDSGNVGELFLAGPMVTKMGYVNQDTPFMSFHDCDCEQRFYGTKDLVRMVEKDLKFCGRADEYAKVGGKWVDMNAVETQLGAIAKECATVWDPIRRIRHVCLVLREGDAAKVWSAGRICPKDSCIHVFSELPRHAVTNKVDRRKLLEMATPSNVKTPRILFERMLKLVPDHRLAVALATWNRKDETAKLLRSWSRKCMRTAGNRSY